VSCDKRGTLLSVSLAMNKWIISGTARHLSKRESPEMKIDDTKGQNETISLCMCLQKIPLRRINNTILQIIFVHNVA
jgi:hypothetical protein